MNSQRTSIGVCKLDPREIRARHERTASRPWQLAGASGFFARCAALMIGILMCPTPAPAGTVIQGVSAFGVGASGANQMNVTVSSLTPLVLQTGNKDEAYSSGVLDGLAGTATISVHACSGPPFPGSSGTASGGVNLDFADQYRIISATLPIGTPVLIGLVANGARRETTTLDVDMGFENTFNGASGAGDANIYFQFPGATYSFPGSFGHTINLFDGESMTHTGLFNGLDSQELKTVVGGKLEGGVVPALVGDYVTVGVSADTLSQSAAAFGATADTDAQMVLNWGVHPLDDSIQIINVTYPGESVPDNSDLTLDQLFPLLPPRPPTIDVPEPGTIILLGQVIAIGLGTACWQLRRS
jgi:hypothetical protein